MVPLDLVLLAVARSDTVRRVSYGFTTGLLQVYDGFPTGLLQVYDRFTTNSAVRVSGSDEGLGLRSPPSGGQERRTLGGPRAAAGDGRSRARCAW
eukprot:1195526-Prorocentrum_minimum.AAC.5